MCSIDIRVEGLSKQYKIGVARRHDSIKELLGDSIRGRWASRRADPESDVLWALRDVSFTVGVGEVVGIVGGNGAGKSTLLKIISRITHPTEGSVELYGRVSCLLEVGTGFHPELTGRENIYLNSAILGMSRAQTRRKFDEIVAFSGVEKFLDTPVKRYSSGMYVRLAFAVAGHQDPEILIVDEVLAVGDAEFQIRCLAKIEEIVREGRTVLFVSHNLSTVHSLCRRVIFLRNGRIAFDGNASEAVASYLGSIEESLTLGLSHRTDRRGSGRSRIVRLTVSGGKPPGPTLATGSPARFTFRTAGIVPGQSCSFTIYDSRSQPVVSFDSAVHSPADVRDSALGTDVTCEIEELPLLPGRYHVNAALSTGPELLDHLEGAAFFEVEPGRMRGRPEVDGHGYGSICAPHRWLQPGRAETWV
jgi:homopolymeric O-antigen transport system ATP-binding protein